MKKQFLLFGAIAVFLLPGCLQMPTKIYRKQKDSTAPAVQLDDPSHTARATHWQHPQPLPHSN